MPQLSAHYFGDLEAFDEATSNIDFFNATFVAPSSMSSASLSNRRKFIIIGRKDVGKTATQMRFASELESKGYFTHHFRFMYDLRSDDFAEISRTQSDISYTSASNEKQLFLHYDFRDVWERVFLRRIGETLISRGQKSSFTELVSPAGSKFKNIFDGLSKALTVKVGANLGPVMMELGLDVAEISNSGSMPLKDFNRISRELFMKHCKQHKFYFFVDELVFSRLDARDDEITLRAAMVRDIIRCSWELNQFSSKNKLDFHFICTLRPEIRDLINERDSEAGKFLDGKDVELSWLATDGDASRLVSEVLRLKIHESHPSKVDVSEFLDSHIQFGSQTQTFEEFLLINSWGRPRDVVRLLNSIAKKSPNSTRIGEAEVKAALDDYSRASAKELIDELGVSYGQKILTALRSGIDRKNFITIWQLRNNITNQH